MTEKPGNRSYTQRGAIPGDKPLLNEEFHDYSPVKEWNWDFPQPRPLSKNKTPKAKVSEPIKTEGAAAQNANDSRFKKAMRLYLTKRWEDALAEFRLVKADAFSDEQRMELAYYMGLCCTKLERYDEALLYFEQVITIGESPVWIYQCRLILAYIYILTGRAKMADAELNRLQSSGLESVMLYNTLAYSAYSQQRYLEAIDIYEKALDIDKDNPTALNGMGFILSDTGLDRLKGLRLCRKAVDRNPGNAAYLDSLGWASYKCGKLKEARALLGQALDIAPKEKEIAEHFRVVSGEVVY